MVSHIVEWLVIMLFGKRITNPDADAVIIVPVDEFVVVEGLISTRELVHYSRIQDS
jgi:hypothetical protein